ncbi:MAG: sigma 54-interacting transcriptional regulator, partial [Pseudohongiella sp.]
GDTRVRQVNVRLVVATNQSLAQKVEQGLFRPDLLYRLNVLPIELPPLRERLEDVPGLASCVLQRLSDRYGQRRTLSRDALDLLCRYHYPGNIRELENLLERVFVLSAGETIEIKDLPQSITEGLYLKHDEPRPESFHQALEQLEYGYLKAACAKHQRQTDIAAELGVSQPTVARMLKKHGMSVRTKSIQK